MSKHLQPICFYVNDREEMINQMFSTVKEDKLRAMLPPILKGLPLAELKSCCLEEVLGMSTKRVKSIVVGRELQSSSDSEDLELSGSDDDPADLSGVESECGSNVDGSSGQRRPSQDARSEDALQIALSSEEIENVLEEPESPVLKTRRHSTMPASGTNPVRLKRSQTSAETKEKLAKVKRIHKPTATNGHAARMEQPVPSDGRTLLEIVELELRARAIRAALTHQEKILDHREVPKSGTGIVIEIKDESGSDKVSVTGHSSLPGTSKDLRKPGDISQSNTVRLPEEQSHAIGSNIPKNEDSIKMICEEISSDEATFDDSTDDGGEEPELIEPVIESIVISSDSEPEKAAEKQPSWKDRWLQKKDIASVMKASKLITNVKRKMKRNKTDKIALAQVMKDQERENTPVPRLEIIQGTVSEFNLLTTATVSSDVEKPSVPPSTVSQLTTEQPTQLSQIEEEMSEQSTQGQSRENIDHNSIIINAPTSQIVDNDSRVVFEGMVAECNRLTAMATPPPVVDERSSGEQSQILPSVTTETTTELSQIGKSMLDNSDIKKVTNSKQQEKSKKCDDSVVKSISHEGATGSGDAIGLPQSSSIIKRSITDHSPDEQLAPVSSADKESIAGEQGTVEAPTKECEELSHNPSALEPEEIVELEPEGSLGSAGPSDRLVQPNADEHTSRHVLSSDGSDEEEEVSCEKIAGNILNDL